MHLYSFVTEQGHILWVMFLLGIGLGLGYDLIRTLRRISKITKEGATLAPQLPKAPPYDGAKDYFLYEDVDDREHMIAFVQATCRELPMPKPKKKKGAT